jgi:hypothetical protein
VGCPVGTPQDRSFPGADGTGSLGPVSTSILSRFSSTAIPVVVAALVALTADCAPGDVGPGTGNPVAATSPATTGAPRVALVVDGREIATATLTDTPTTRDLAARLPISVEMADRFGQATTGQLPGALLTDDAEGLLDPSAGQFAYWPPGNTLAVVTTDLGPSVPKPGLVVLGVVDSGLAALGALRGSFEMTIEPAG